MADAEQKAMRVAANHDAKRKAILAAARRVIAREGFPGLTMRAVAAEAGYVPGAVYFYFASKDELASGLVSDELHQLARRLKDRDQSRETLDAAQRIARLAEETFRSLAHESHLIALAADMFDRGAVPPEAERLLNGRLIGALTALGAPASEIAPAAEASRHLTLAVAALVLGTAVLARAGRLEVLGADPTAILRFGIERLTASA